MARQRQRRSSDVRAGKHRGAEVVSGGRSLRRAVRIPRLQQYATGAARAETEVVRGVGHQRLEVPVQRYGLERAGRHRRGHQHRVPRRVRRNPVRRDHNLDVIRLRVTGRGVVYRVHAIAVVHGGLRRCFYSGRNVPADCGEDALVLDVPGGLDGVRVTVGVRGADVHHVSLAHRRDAHAAAVDFSLGGDGVAGIHGRFPRRARHLVHERLARVRDERDRQRPRVRGREVHVEHALLHRVIARRRLWIIRLRVRHRVFRVVPVGEHQREGTVR